MSQRDEEIKMALTPLETLFRKLPDDKMAIYVKKLERFTLDDIRAGVDKLSDKWDTQTFPPIGAIVKECEKVSERSARGDKGFDDGTAWQNREKNIESIVRSYMETFKMSATMLDAKAQGYDYFLYKYVVQVARVQAQLIYRRPCGSVGLDWNIIGPEGVATKDIGKVQHNFIAEQKEITDKGSIDVSIPVGKIQEWLARAALDRETYRQGQNSLTKPISMRAAENVESV